MDFRTLLRASAGTAPTAPPTPTPTTTVAAALRDLRLGAVITEEEALSIPTASACVNLIAGTVAQLHAVRFRGNERLPSGVLLTDPDPAHGATWAQTIQRTAADLVLHGRAAWLILARNPDQASEQNPYGLPVRARHVPARYVAQIRSQNLTDRDPVEGYNVAGTRVDPHAVIYFDAGRPGVLESGARALLQAYELEEAARRMASVELPAGVLVGTGHELSQAEADALVTGFTAARKANAIAYLQNVEYQRTDLSAHDLQMTEARANAATEICRLIGPTPVALVGASPTGGASALLYANVSSNMAQFVQTAVAPILAVIESTLSADTVTPHGQEVRFDVQAFLRSSPDAAAAYVTDLLAAEVIDTTEARSYLGIPPTGATDPTLSPGSI